MDISKLEKRAESGGFIDRDELLALIAFTKAISHSDRHEIYSRATSAERRRIASLVRRSKTPRESITPELWFQVAAQMADAIEEGF